MANYNQLNCNQEPRDPRCPSNSRSFQPATYLPPFVDSHTERTFQPASSTIGFNGRPTFTTVRSSNDQGKNELNFLFIYQSNIDKFDFSFTPIRFIDSILPTIPTPSSTIPYTTTTRLYPDHNYHNNIAPNIVHTNNYIATNLLISATVQHSTNYNNNHNNRESAMLPR